MELERCRALLCAIETGSISAAAERLGYTPSGVSRMLAALEDETGLTLLLREHSGVRPTADCERLLPALRELLFSGDAFAQLAAQIRGLDTGTVVIGTAYSAYYLWLARVTSAFHAQYPGIQVQFCSGYSTDLAERLAQHQLDLCIISEREGAHDWTPLRRDELQAWVPESHPLAQGRAVPVAAFAEEPYIETFPGVDIDNTRVFERCGVKPNLKFATMDSHATYAMVEAGLGVCMNNALNGLGRTGAVRMLPLDPPQTVSIGIASLHDASPAARTFLRFAEPYLAELRDADSYPQAVKK